MAPASPGVRPLAVAPLPPRTASLVRSAVVVPSLQSILQELVQNSLDAHARAIHCAIDLDTWTLRCDDSGHGIPPLDLRQLAAPSTDSRNLTSKHTGDDLDGPTTYGFRGEALASIRDLATLDIRTRPRARGLDTDDGSTWHLVLRGEHCLAFEQAQVERTGPGTTVTVRDIFHKLPVRRRPLAKPAAQASLVTSLRSTLATLALLHPHVAFSLTDTTTSLSSLSSVPRVLVSVARSTEGVVGRWRQLWGRAGIEKVWEFDELEAVGDEHEGQLRATGFFSLSAAHSKAGQYVYVNSRPLAASSSLIHKHVNALFASSSFARFAVSHLATPSSTSPARAAATSKSPRRPVERHPKFVIALEVPGRIVDVSLEPEKRVVEFEDPDRVERLIERLVKRFLTVHGFLHVAPVVPPVPAADASTAAPPAALAPAPSSKRPRFFAAMTAPLEPEHKNEHELAVRPAKRLAQAVSSAAPVAHPSLGSSSPGPGDFDDAGDVQRWVDPKTGEAWCVDSRTGNSWRAGASAPPGTAAVQGAGVDGCDGCGGVRQGTEGKVDRSALKRRRDEDGEEEVPQWLRDSLENWQNPVFPSAAVARTIPSLPPLPTAATTLATSFRSTKYTTPFDDPSHKPARTTADAFFRTTRPPPGLELPALGPLGAPASTGAWPVAAREQLAGAECVAQVDCKYLLVRVPPPAPSPPTPSSSERNPSSAADPGPATLVLIDQHAASERVRVERLYAAVIGAVARGERPATTPARLGLVVSASEYGALRDRWRGEFERWGIEVELGAGAGEGASGGRGGEYRQVELTAVPSAVALRLLSPREPHLAQELVRAFVAQLDEDGPAPAAAPRAGGGEGGASSWVAMLRHAPRVLKELLDSKACRGAVMFNDVLAPPQQAALLAQLAETLFPGQCAHARPSMVPIVRLSARAASEARARDEQIDWARFG